MGYKRLYKNLIDIIKEEQAKLGFRRESIRLYYPLSSLNHFFETQDTEEQMKNRLHGIPDFIKETLGDIKVTSKKERFCFYIPEEGSNYVHENTNPNEFIKEYKNILMLPSYHDLKNENSYHMMMLGMCLCLSRDYEIISNRETGKGRFDLVLKAKYSKSTSFVLEFKYLKGTSKNLESDLDNLTNEAIEQIQSKNYSFDLKEKVIYIGLAHHGKDVKMKWVER